MSSDDSAGFDRLHQIWQRESVVTRDDVSARAAQVIRQARALDLQIRRRDRLESGVALLALPLFGWLAVVSSEPLARIGALLVGLGCIVTPLQLRRARRRPPDPGLPLIEGIRLELERIRAQEQLLASVGWWYFGPLGGGVVLLVLGGRASVGFKVGFTVFAVLVNGALFAMNRRAIRTQLAPRAAQLEALIERETELL